MVFSKHFLVKTASAEDEEDDGNTPMDEGGNAPEDDDGNVPENDNPDAPEDKAEGDDYCLMCWGAGAIGGAMLFG